MRRITILSVLLVITLFSASSCAPTVSREEYDRVSNELSAVKSQLASLQGKLAEAELLQAQNKELNTQYNALKSGFEIMQDKYEELSTEYDQLTKQFDTVSGEFDVLQTRYKELNKQFEDLSKQSEITVKEPEEIKAADVEQAVFRLINEERKKSGLNELMWGENLYKWAIANSRNMVTEKSLEYTKYSSNWQEVYWAAGHSSTDAMANAVFLIWKNSQLYERNFLNNAAKYCAIAVYKSGEIFYITYLADYFK